MTRRLVLVAGAALLALTVGLFVACHSTEHAVMDRIDADGLLTRVEVEDHDEDAEPPIDATTLKARLAAHREINSPPPSGVSMLLRHPAAAKPLTFKLPKFDGFDPFEERGCPPEGTASGADRQAWNRLKNRISVPKPSDFDHRVTLAAIRRPGDDRTRWSESNAAVIEGYVKSVKGTGAETCNCGETDRRLTDTHFDITAGPDDDDLPIIVEITPPWRLIHEHLQLEDWSSKSLKAKFEHKRVRIMGWLFFDRSHLNEATNTDPNDTIGKVNWRGSCWEIHPVVTIELAE